MKNKSLQQKAIAIISLVCLFYWIIDSFWSYFSYEQNLKYMIFSEPVSWMETFMLKVPPYQMVSRCIVVFLFIAGGTIILLFLARQQKNRTRLEQNQRLFTLITENTSALVSIFDHQGNYLFASPSHNTLGYPPDTLLGQSIFELIVKEDVKKMKALLHKTRAGHLSNATADYRVRHKDGSIHHFRGSFDGVFNPDGSLQSVISVAENNTRLLRAQQEKMAAVQHAAESEKLALVGRIAGKMAHDFNNVLSAIMGNTELAIMDCPHEPTIAALELIQDQTFKGRNLTRNLVAFARDQEPRQSFFVIKDKIELVLTLLKKDLQGIRIRCDHGHDMPELLADPGMIEHALVNLIQNSVHALSLTREPEIIISTALVPGRIRIQVSDNGCGIPKEALGRIFEPSFTLKGGQDITGAYRPGIKGTGYGMANIQKYISQHNGTIDIESTAGRGTCVTVCLPVIGRQMTSDEIKEVKKELQTSGKSILLVEDEKTISDVQYRVLTQAPCSHRADIASTGQAAMEYIDQKGYDLVILDYILQGTITGMDVYRHLRQINTQVPVLFISGNLEFLESIKHLKAQDLRVDHISKPCTNKDFIYAADRLLAADPDNTAPGQT